YLVIKVNQDEDINAFDLSDFLSSVTYFYREFSNEAVGEPLEDLSIKIKLQSRGRTVLKATVYSGIFGIATLVLLSNNSEFEASIGENNISFKTDGLLQSMTDFLNENQERKIRYEIFKDSIQNLKANVTEEVADNNLEEDISDSKKEI